jgi:phosphoserine/homoserine phosphotransferase
MKKLHAVCSDLEGVWVPEVWINVAEKTGISELRLTTRDIKDYDELMQYRLKILKEKNLTLLDIQRVIATIRPLHGALDMINWLKRVTRFIVVSDTFVEFADPLMDQLDRPTLFCHSLEVNGHGMITGYNLRQKNAKKINHLHHKNTQQCIIQVQLSGIRIKNCEIHLCVFCHKNNFIAT